ncbi:MAG: hypothetical protein K2J85_07685 [Anaeroplasmataceae bacterium]|nr:hypothetical protein [Anaeroplasmataceae bacterium]
MKNLKNEIDNFFATKYVKSKAFCFMWNHKDGSLVLIGTNVYSSIDNAWVYFDKCMSDKIHIESSTTQEEILQEIQSYLENGKYNKYIKKFLGAALVDDGEFLLIFEKKKVNKIVGPDVSKFNLTNSGAGQPGGFILSHKKLFDIFHSIEDMNPQEIEYARKHLNTLQEHIYMGDTQPAVVVCLDPFLIAAYSDEMDAVVLLNFPQKLAEIYSLSIGDSLLSVNLYYHRGKLAYDIHPGFKYSGVWDDFIPVITEFITDDQPRTLEHKEAMEKEIWADVKEKGESYRNKYPYTYRDGFWYLKRK